MKIHRPKTLRTTFLLWLLGLMSLTFVAMFIVSYDTLTKSSIKDADLTIKNRLEDAETVIRDNNRSLQSMMDYNDNEVKYKATSSRAALNMLSDEDFKRLTPFSVDESKLFRALYFEAYYDYENHALPFYEISAEEGIKPYKNSFSSGEVRLDNRVIYLTKEEKASNFDKLTQTFLRLIRNSDRFLDTFGVSSFNLISGTKDYGASKDNLTSGYIISSTVPGFIGYDMYQRYIDEEKLNTQSLDFMKNLFEVENDGTFVQEIKQDITGTYIVYGGSKDIKRRPADCTPLCCIEISFFPEKGMEILKRSDINTSAKTFRISSSGGICICTKSNEGNYIIRGATNAGEGQPNNYLLGKTVEEVFDANSKFFDTEKPDFKDAIFSKIPLRMSWRIVEDDPSVAVDEDYLVIGVILYNEIYESRDASLINVAIAEVITFVMVYILTSLLVELKVARRLKKVNSSLSLITEGDLKERVEEKGNREFVELSKKINAMVDSLKELIENEKNRFQDDLAMARDIQKNALPGIFPPFPNHDEFNIFASMIPAKEVGGDFYDFFFTSSDTLCFMIADVSGKGIPASLFMMRAKTLIKGLAETRKYSPGEILTIANKALCEGNKAGMFVTAFFIMFNLKNGKGVYSNAGHNPPLLRRGDKFTYLSPDRNLVMGVMDQKVYKETSFKLKEGDAIYLYTDGITEAMDVDGNLYGEDRLLQALNKLKPTVSTEDLVSAITDDVMMFVGNADQSDDMTQVAFIYHGSKRKSLSYTYPDSTESLAKCQKDIKHFLGMKINPDLLNDILVVCEEIFVNICSYSNTKSHSLDLSLNRENNIFTMSFIDDGIAFNPLKKDDPDVTLKAKERKIGGLGIFMIKKLSNETSYERKDGRNILTVKFKIK